MRRPINAANNRRYICRWNKACKMAEPLLKRHDKTTWLDRVEKRHPELKAFLKRFDLWDTFVLQCDTNKKIGTGEILQRKTRYDFGKAWY